MIIGIYSINKEVRYGNELRRREKKDSFEQI